MSGEPKPEPSLEAAYELETPEDNRKLYAEWAETYESGFIAENDYVYHQQVAAIFAEGFADSSGPVLDVGCGTGVVGEQLRTLAIETVDGIDISPEMLAMARSKVNDEGPTYRDLIEADLTKTIQIEDGSYRGIVSAGAFTHGHLGPESLDELLRVGSPGAHYAIGVNGAHFEQLGFRAQFDRYQADGTITDYQIVDASIYSDADESDLNSISRVAVFNLAVQ